MIIDVQHTRLSIGDNTDTERLINLPFSEPLEFSYQQNSQNVVAVMAANLSTERKVDRLVDLLFKLNLQDDTVWKTYQGKPVFWLLPNLSANELQHWVSVLHQHLPHCFEHPLTRIFPNGSASLMFAFKALEAMPFDSQSVVLISVDSLFFDLAELSATENLITEEQGSGSRPAEAAMVTNLRVNTTGLSIDLLSQNNCSLVQQTQTIQSLFQQANKACEPELFNQLYLPGANQTVTDNWLNAYEQLAGRIDSDSDISQTTNFTGDIGCVSGLYNFVHLFNRYEQQTVTGKSLQLEVSQTLHLGLATYSWIEA